DVIGGTGIVLNGGAGLLTITTTNSDVRFNGAVTLNSDVTIDTGGGAGNITFTAGNAGTGKIDSQANEHNDLTLNAGTGSVFFNGNIGTTAAAPLGSVVVDPAAGGVTFGGADNATIGATGPVTTVHTENQIDIGTGVTAAEEIAGTGSVPHGGTGRV